MLSKLQTTHTLLKRAGQKRGWYPAFISRQDTQMYSAVHIRTYGTDRFALEAMRDLLTAYVTTNS